MAGPQTDAVVESDWFPLVLELLCAKSVAALERTCPVVVPMRKKGHIETMVRNMNETQRLGLSLQRTWSGQLRSGRLALRQREVARGKGVVACCSARAHDLTCATGTIGA